jgi:hypothetical protein
MKTVASGVEHVGTLNSIMHATDTMQQHHDRNIEIQWLITKHEEGHLHGTGTHVYVSALSWIKFIEAQ